MTPTWADFELSMRRSPARRRVLLMLASLSVSHPGPLARACGVNWSRLRAILHGKAPAYRVELALVPLGLAREVLTQNGRAYEITERGRRKARQLTAREGRRAVRRAALRRVLGPAPAEAGVRPPVPAAPVEWTYTCILAPPPPPAPRL